MTPTEKSAKKTIKRMDRLTDWRTDWQLSKICDERRRRREKERGTKIEDLRIRKAPLGI